MRVQKLNNNTTFTNGVYFSKASNICFDKGGNFVNPKAFVRTSENGYKYIEDISIPEILKKRLLENEYIKNLAQQFDTFIWHKQFPVDKKKNNGYISMVKIWWADLSKAKGQKEIIGVSKTNTDEALENMFEKLK